jgi:hypothetical protein
MTYVIALLGVKALYLLIGWMLAAIIAQDLSDMKAYGEKPGLATGLLLSGIAVIVWLAWPAKRGSAWDRRIKVPDLVLAVAAFVTIISLLFKWYSGGQKFFDEFAIYDVLLPLGAALCYAQLHARGRESAPGWVGTVAVAGAVLALAATVLQAIDKPDGSSISIGFFICAVSSLVMLGASLAALRADRTAGSATTLAEARSQAAGTA